LTGGGLIMNSDEKSTGVDIDPTVGIPLSDTDLKKMYESVKFKIVLCASITLYALLVINYIL
jgi:hypothetical protein